MSCTIVTTTGRSTYTFNTLVYKRIISIHKLYNFNDNSRKLVATVITEHGHQGIQHYLALVQVSTSHINKYILCVQCNLGVFTCTRVHNEMYVMHVFHTHAHTHTHTHTCMYAIQAHTHTLTYVHIHTYYLVNFCHCPCTYLHNFSCE